MLHEQVRAVVFAVNFDQRTHDLSLARNKTVTQRR
jgi:hypothetical protein